MGLIVGPTSWWQSSLVSICPVGTTLPDSSKIICKAGGTAWIVAPSSTQVTSAWAGGQYNSTLVGDKCCVSEWSGLNVRLIQCGFNPLDWFVPSISQLANPGVVCRTQWDSFVNNTCYWSSTEVTSTTASLHNITGGFGNFSKSTSVFVRAFRCVTY
jgi:hypothetical protein